MRAAGSEERSAAGARLREGSWSRRTSRRTAPAPASSEAPETGAQASSYGELQGVYVISVAARLLDMHPQTLRKYERIGLVSPSRSMGMLRLYSDEDIARLRAIKHLVEDVGLNLAGVEMAFSLLERLTNIRRQFDDVSPEWELRSALARVQSLVEETLRMLDAGPPDDDDGDPR